MRGFFQAICVSPLATRATNLPGLQKDGSGITGPQGTGAASMGPEGLEPPTKPL